MDRDTRNLLANTTQALRRGLEEEFALQLEGRFDVFRDGSIAGGPGPQLDDAEKFTRHKIVEAVQHRRAAGESDKDSVDAFLREAAFTFLNRLAALKMMEARGIVQECVTACDTQGFNARGFKEFGGLAPGLTELPDGGYRLYLECLFDEIGREVGILFDRTDPASLLWPRRAALLDALGRINDPKLAGIWSEDETIGWIYQYYNDPEERRKMRDVKQGGSAAPRNSREMAVRNQFFTPRYVVEFLTDNALGRLWYEMTKGKTSLKDRCRFLIKRPFELFLPGPETLLWHDAAGNDAFRRFSASASPHDLPQDPALGVLLGWLDHVLPGDMEPPLRGVGTSGEEVSRKFFEPLQSGSPSEDLAGAHPIELLAILWRLVMLATHGGYGDAAALVSADKVAGPVWSALRHRLPHPPENLSKEEQLWQPVFVPHRPIKDPREIRMIDPACGSMHFGLYAFDLFEIIYQEAPTFLGPLAPIPKSSSSTDHCSPITDHLSPRDVPALILGHNIHGVDIDPRAAQIAGLALWLRAQRAWQEQGLRPADRPTITRSNIVCAEPMPGEEDLLQQFVVRSFSPTERPFFSRLLGETFKTMRLAGEAGSLLKIEDEVSALVADARAQWKKIGKHEGEFFSNAEILNLDRRTLLEKPIDTGSWSLSALSGIPDLQFWEKAEERIYRALRDFAETTGADGYQRRLFADDAASGFAFIDLCRQRYDVALMNPPFGQFPAGIERFMRNLWGSHANDAYVPFVLWAASRLCTGGRLGAISSRNFLIGRDQRDFRPLIIGKGDAYLELFVDLGLRVLDGAEVDTASYILCARSLASTDGCNYWDFRKEDRDALHGLADLMRSTASTFRKHRDFWETPANLIAYSASSDELSELSSGARLDPEFGRVTKGLNSSDDFRFLKLFWEIPHENIGKRWIYCAKGADYSWIISNITTVVDWRNNGELIAAFAAEVGDNVAQARRSSAYYYKPALTHTYRCDDFSLRALPAGCIFTNGSPIICPKDPTSLVDLLTVFMSKRFEKLLSYISKKGLYETGRVGLLPQPPRRYNSETSNEWQAISSCLMTHEMSLENSTNFLRPSCTEQGLFDSHECKKRLSEFAILSGEEISYSFIERAVKGFSDRYTHSPKSTVEWLSYSIGCIFGRWDLRFTTGENPAPLAPGPFDPLPVCPPGMLQNANGLPATPADVPANYPLRISWPGILVDDKGHDEDIETRVREVLVVVFRDRTDEIVHESCEILGVKTLREFFRKPAAFFAGHLSRHSKSRRQAPIYWPLSSPNGRYTLWLYYPRLTADTLFTALRDFLEPKLQYEEGRAFRIRQDAGATPAPSQRAEIAEADELVDDLRALRDELKRVAPLFKPDLNDGVILNHAPLWRMIGLPKWRKDCQAAWEKLAAGDYDWAHLALHLWPERVIPKCATDRSLAIAHGLEDFFWEEIPADELPASTRGRSAKKAAKKKAKAAPADEPPEDSETDEATTTEGTGKWRARKVPAEQVQQLIATRSSPAVKDALAALASAPTAGGAKKKAKKQNM